MKQKIVFIASYPQSLLNFRLALMQAFLKKGYEVIAIAPEDTSVEDSLSQFHIQYIPLSLKRNGMNPISDVKWMVSIIQILRRERPTAVFSYTIKPVIYGSFAAKLAGVPRIYSLITGTGYVFLRVNLKNKIVGWIAQKLFKWALRFNTLVYFQNPDNLTLFREKKILSLKKPVAVVNGSGVDCDAFSPMPYPENISFLMIARFLCDKGIREYVRAAQRIKKEDPSIPFYLVGWIDTNPNSISQRELEEWIEEGTIEYLGKLEDVRPAITRSSVYVLPSYHEGTPRTVLEAMAMSRPIITTDAPGCRETVVPNQNGFLVPIQDVDALYDAMKYFLDFPEKIALMGEESRRLAVSKYDVHRVNQAILDAM